MLDIKSVGCDLTPEEKDEAMTDLAFFLDAFGSTRAVRIKLQEQEKGIKRLGNKIRQLLRQQDKRFPQEEKNHPPTTRSSNHKTAEDVDETVENLDFFLRTYGSTRAVRNVLERRRRELLGLRRTVQWFQERHQMLHEGPDSVEAIIPTKFPDKTAPRPDGSEQIEPQQLDRVDINAEDATDGAVLEGNGVHVGNINCNSVEISLQKRATTELQSEKDEVAHPEQASKYRCRHPDCSSKGIMNGLCYRHGGYHSCKIDDCSRKAVTRRLCRRHGGGTMCKIAGRGTVILNGAKGLCYTHAQEQGITLAHEKRQSCKEPGCKNWGRTGGARPGYCFPHGGEIRCNVSGCNKKRKLKGLCKAHGGYHKCKIDECQTQALVQGFCKAHYRVRSKKISKCVAE